MAIGSLGALIAGRILESSLFGVAGYDPLVFMTATLMVIVVVAAATYLPMRHASRLTAMDALRYQ
jgi:ABC-type antimicrobial peptide transport system permease subunit